MVIKMFNISRKSKNPVIVIESKILKNKIATWLRYNGNVSKQFAKVLVNLGFDSSDEIVLYDFVEPFTIKYYVKNSDKKGAFCLIDGRIEREPGYINLKMVYAYPKIIHSYNNIRERYECMRDLSGKIGNGIKMVGYDMDLTNDVLYRRSLFSNMADVSIDKDEYSIHISASNVANIPVDDSSYELDNENLLMNYLSSLNFPVNIIEVYKKICEISLGNIDEYRNFSLTITKIINSTGEEKVTDTINLTNGKLEQFKITREGKSISIDKFGVWNYETVIDHNLVSVSYIDDYDEDFGYISSNGYMQEFDSFKNVVSEEVSDVKRKVRVLFDKNKGSK